MQSHRYFFEGQIIKLPVKDDVFAIGLVCKVAKRRDSACIYFVGFCNEATSLIEAELICDIREYNEFIISGPLGFNLGKWNVLGNYSRYEARKWQVPLLRIGEGDESVLVTLDDQLAPFRIVQRAPANWSEFECVSTFGYEAIEIHLWNIYNAFVYPTTDPAVIWRLQHLYKKTLVWKYS